MRLNCSCPRSARISRAPSISACRNAPWWYVARVTNSPFGFSALWGWTAWRGYKAIRERDIRSHQAWMIRNFALTYAAVTLRLWFGVLTFAQLPFVQGENRFDTILAEAYAPLPFLCWLPNIVIAEWMIRRRGPPALRITTSTSTGPGKPTGEPVPTQG
ncbi:DUF2306 domain-containing protein [Streptomyces sp. NPDC050844]|uniref:DUF2306 domain-containing protein n=1 Tax=Streptomyces sp. NPDC050844 TaxID=3155790 RepID=UPI0033FD92FD